MRHPRSLLARMYDAANEENLRNIERALATAGPRAALVDLGCDDGERTLRFAHAARAAEVHGLELIEHRAALAEERGVKTTIGDLREPLPYADRRFDAVVSNQVIEHLANTDRFVSEIRRVLKPGGVAVVSTENLASWHNVAALVLGWQPFSLTNVSSIKGGLGNPAALHRGEADAGMESWQHLRVFSFRGLRELFEAHGFDVRSVLGAGYYPLPARLGRIEPRHAAFLTIVARAS
jgi:SAM-dependent methyltransferase